MSSSIRYNVVISKVAKRDLRELKKFIDHDQLIRIDAKIQNLKKDPRPLGCESMKGMPGTYRIRDGDYRVLYAVDDDARLVKICRVRDRKDVYRH